MGHYRSEMIGDDEIQQDKRFEKALKIQDKLMKVPLSLFTFGDLTFLLDLYEFKHSHHVSVEELRRLQSIVRKVKIKVP